jgi:hypothetical protein
MWEIGVPAFVASEDDPFNNPHFDQSGGDVFSTIDNAYHEKIARLDVAFTAQLAGVAFAPSADAGAADAGDSGD